MKELVKNFVSLSCICGGLELALKILPKVCFEWKCIYKKLWFEPQYLHKLKIWINFDKIEYDEIKRII